MHVNPHPYVMTTLARQRQEAIQAAADHHRRARLAQRTGRGNRRQHWADLLATTAVAQALLGAGVATVQTPAPALSALSSAVDSITTHLLASDWPEASAVQKVREAA